MAIRVWLTRHGDRTDYEMGLPAWQAVANPNRVKDSPLSALGNQQAVEMGKEAAKNIGHFTVILFRFYLRNVSELSLFYEITPGKIDRIITSPFLRCLETVKPLGLALNLPLLVDYSLFEGMLPSTTTTNH